MLTHGVRAFTMMRPFRRGYLVCQASLEREDVLALLQQEVNKAGGQVAWAKKIGVSRPNLNRILKGHRPLTEAVLTALGLRTVYVTKDSRRGK